MNRNKVYGWNDEPASEDQFGIDKYIDGLATFINGCTTPMTIAIQGDWGSGKSTIMKLVERKLALQKTKIINFNTWQYDQFDQDNDLPILLMQYIIRRLGSSDKDSADYLMGATKMLKKGVAGVVDAFFGGVAAEVTERGFDKALDGTAKVMTGEDNVFTKGRDISSEMVSIKMKLSQLINSVLETEGRERVVIFIDDIDRLKPEKAVELLEAIKVFMDCEKCVFVLAIDYSVVANGVSQKYGVDVHKGKQFFDKIIQVPFRVPLSEYNMTRYIRQMLEESNTILDTESQEVFERLVKYSTQNNPRAIKRLFNTYRLLGLIWKEWLDVAEKKKTELFFGIVCMQIAYEEAYADVREMLRDQDYEGMNQFFTMSEDNQDEYQERYKLDEDIFDFFIRFVDTYGSILNSTRVYTENDYEILADVFKMTNAASITKQDDFGLKKREQDVVNQTKMILSKLDAGILSIFEKENVEKIQDKSKYRIDYATSEIQIGSITYSAGTNLSMYIEDVASYTSFLSNSFPDLYWKLKYSILNKDQFQKILEGSNDKRVKFDIRNLSIDEKNEIKGKMMVYLNPNTASNRCHIVFTRIDSFEKVELVLAFAKSINMYINSVK